MALLATPALETGVAGRCAPAPIPRIRSPMLHVRQPSRFQYLPDVLFARTHPATETHRHRCTASATFRVPDTSPCATPLLSAARPVPFLAAARERLDGHRPPTPRVHPE